ncbi:MAG: hypothetical protein A2770_00820 [Candidatus Levybacteria bacterium RIFCSPHIGHO2_01_FULL_38_12]|nr:MAG: hypothetical protein A2770_00820 [Candidatus Levybacteria bacterium RIFCSPHIGHO2_01_FULL_38_12]
MDVLKFLTVLLLLFFPLGEVTRFSIGNSIAFTLIDILVGVLVLNWIAFIALKKMKARSSLLYRPVFIFVGTAILSLFINYSLFTQYELFVSSLYLLRWILYSCVLFIIMYFNTEFKTIIKKLLLLSGGIIVLIGFIQYFFYQNLRNLFYLGWDDHLYRLFSSFFDPNYAGSFYVLYFLFVLGFVFEDIRKKDRKKITLFSAIEMITGIAIVLTYSRSAMISLLVSTSIFFVLIRKKKLLLLSFVLVVFIFVALSPFFYIENINIFRTASGMARIESMNNALTIIKDYPILGVGFNTYRYVQIKYGFRKGIGALVSHADAGTDNSFLFVFATIGVIGLIAYLNLWNIIIKKFLNLFKKTHSVESILVLCSIIAIFIDSLFVNSLFFPPLMLWMWILIGIMG